VVWRRASYEAPSVAPEDATLAQSVEQLIRNQQVVGSNPTGGSNKIKDFSTYFIPANLTV
jgi:hypothetical protein